MALPAERFFMLIDILQERLEERARDDLTQAAFIAWQVAQHQWAAMFRHVGFSVDAKQQSKFKQQVHDFWKDFPNFDRYLRDLGILKDS